MKHSPAAQAARILGCTAVLFLSVELLAQMEKTPTRGKSAQNSGIFGRAFSSERWGLMFVAELIGTSEGREYFGKQNAAARIVGAAARLCKVVQRFNIFFRVYIFKRVCVVGL